MHGWWEESFLIPHLSQLTLIRRQIDPSLCQINPISKSLTHDSQILPHSKFTCFHLFYLVDCSYYALFLAFFWEVGEVDLVGVCEVDDVGAVGEVVGGGGWDCECSGGLVGFHDSFVAIMCQ